MTYQLAVQDLHAYYGDSHILQGVNIQVQAGEIVGVLGRNGAGRSTLLKAIIGQVRATGQITVADQLVIGLPTYDIAMHGVAYVPESRDIFPGLTVEQNLLLGQKRGQTGGRWTLDYVYALFPQLQKRKQIQAGRLSGGEQQLLSLSRAMMGNPSVLLVDEPTEGLSPQMTEAVSRFLEEIRLSGVAILLIEQKQSFLLQVAQRVYVMGRGRIVFEGTPHALRADTTATEWLAV
jgi:branched-chain amino acid transport system ATP-binding protein